VSRTVRILCWPLTCRKSCSEIRTIIDKTAILQYKIALAIEGLEYGPHKQAPADQLESLTKYSEAWERLTWTSDFRILQGDGDTWELFGNVLALEHKQGIQFCQLPSVRRSVEQKSWALPAKFVPFNIRDFGMDPSQDLLVVVEDPRWYLRYFACLMAGWLTIVGEEIGASAHTGFTCAP
jgi:hypothetical protein